MKFAKLYGLLRRMRFAQSFSAFQKVIFVLLALLLLAWVFYALLGAWIIKALYDGRILILGRRVISQEAGFPLQNYLDYAQYLMAAGTFWYTAAVSCLLGLFIIHKRKQLAVVIVNLLIVVLFFEIMGRLLFAHPGLFKKLPKRLLWQARQLYALVDLNVIQAREEYTRYDPEVTYTLKPGVFRFSSFEFDTSYYVNKMGFRDDEESLLAPEIIVVGDSYAMGYGVKQEETFAQVIERRTGYKVLNTAISSYGTVREMRILNRLDLSRLKYLVIQYCFNDFNENQEFLEKGSLNIRSRQIFEKDVREYTRRFRNRNIFGKYVFFLSRNTAGFVNAWIKKLNPNWLWIGVSREEDLKWSQEKEAPVTDGGVEVFLHAVTYASQADLSNVQIIVLVLDTQEKDDRAFLTALNREKRRPKYPRHIQNLSTVELSSHLPEEYHFVLDGHINKKGHDKVAEEVIRVLEKFINDEDKFRGTKYEP
ncbi:MAG: hypothetical protein JW847_10165 [Candidatus Omnitrophica bacterium]|nr:hypothetical protein [Candidatus Omnitrophota bacterium]